MTTELAHAGPTAVGPAMSQEELDELFGAAGPIRPKIAFAKMNRKDGVIQVPGPDGTPMDIACLENAVICFVQKGRVEWDPDAPPTSGFHLCRSADGLHPAPSASDGKPGKFPPSQLCASCPDAQWGPKPTNPKSKAEREAWKPKCGESKSLLLRVTTGDVEAGQGDTSFLVLRVDGTGLEMADEFLGRSFINAVPRRPYWNRFVDIWLEGIERDGYKFFIPRFALKGETSEEIRADGIAAFKAYKDVMASNGFEDAVEQGIEPTSPAGEAPANVTPPPAGETRTVEVQSKPVVQEALPTPAAQPAARKKTVF